MNYKGSPGELFDRIVTEIDRFPADEAERIVQALCRRFDLANDAKEVITCQSEQAKR